MESEHPLGLTNSEGNDLKTLTKTLHKCPSQCLICGKIISDRRNLVRHLRKIHGVEPLIRKPQLKCSFSDDCTFLCATSEALREHLKAGHDCNIEKKILNFKSRSDFEKWKQEEEIRTNARYVSYTGTKFRGTKKVCYLRCHRSGAIRLESNSKERKRSKPARGYTQCGATCPSSMTMAESDNGSVHVMYYPVHLGHTLDDESIQYMKLSLKDEEEIVGKLAQGEPVGKIVSDARKKKGLKFSRINLLQKRDVYNIKKKINYLEKEEDHDGKIIDAWVKNLTRNQPQSNPIALYHPMDDAKEYTLILIHNIQKIMYSIAFDGSIVYVKIKKGKPNVDFHLTSVNVICENGNGYPIAFCISNKTEYLTLYTFFKIVHQNFGTIKTQIFISDNSSQVYLAWKNIMGECDNKLICTFGIESHWEQKLSLLKCPVNKQKEAGRQLKYLLNQSNRDIFESELSQTLKAWSEDKDMWLFSNFFQKFYAKRRFEWANCYRINSATKETVNKHLESINGMLDSIYVESYANLENSLNYLFVFVRDVCLLQLLRWDEHIKMEKLRETKANHEESSKVGSLQCNGSEWVVTDENFDYIVKRNDSDCDKKCGLLCEACNICTHNYNCVCSDYVTGFNICRHVHAVGISSARNTSGTNTSRDRQDFSSVASRLSAVASARSLADELDGSNLTNEQYNEIMQKISLLREGIAEAIGKKQISV